MNTKTQFCRHPICNLKDKCTYAHSLEEYNPPLCSYDKSCRNKACVRIHKSRETFDQFIKRVGLTLPDHLKEKKASSAEEQSVLDEARRILADAKLKNAHFAKSKPCKHQVCVMASCNFAHSLEDFVAPKCLYKQFCPNKKTCKLVHPEDDVNEYIKNNNITFQQDNNGSCINSKLCNIMTDETRCNKLGCAYAHSIYELNIIKNHDGCSCQGLCEHRLKLLESLGCEIKPFMLRDANLNKVDLEAINNEMKEHCKEFIDKIITMDCDSFVKELVEISSDIAKIVIDEEEESEGENIVIKLE